MIENNKVVTIHYHLTDEEGAVIDSSQGAEPLLYLHGFGNIVPGLENALAGKAVGDELKVEVAPEEAYGEIQEALYQQVPRTAFPAEHQLEVGQAFSAQGEDGPFEVEIVEITEDTVTVNANHPLAGIKLHFDVQIIDVRDATEQELEHGHIHSDEHVHSDSCNH